MNSFFKNIIAFDWRETACVLASSWVSVASILAGVFIFGGTLQGADLFIVSTTNFLSAACYWLIFFILTLVLWVLPLFICTKLILVEVQAAKIAPTLKFQDTTIERAPRIVAVSALAALLLGEHRAAVSIIATSVDLLQDEHGILDYTTAWMPQLFSPVLMLFGLGLGLTITGARRAAFSIISFGLLLTFGVLVAIKVINSMEFNWETLLIKGEFEAWSVAFLLIPTAALIPIAWQWTARLSSEERQLRKTFKTVLWGSFACASLLALIDPLLSAQFIRQAYLIPVVFGVWIAPLTLLRLYSVRTRLPCVLITFLLIGCLPFLFGDGHDLRRLDYVKTDSHDRIGLEESLMQWARSNGCIIGTKDPNKRCPPPILVASAGGASRSAFYTGAVIGELIDLTKGAKEPSQRFSNRLFAVSGISGGAVGLAFHRAALAQSYVNQKIEGHAELEPPCDVSRLATDRFFVAAESVAKSQIMTWRYCLEALAAGDFLSPTILSLAFRDAIELNLLFEDRAATLERTWEDRFRSLTASNWMAQDFWSLRSQVQAINPEAWIPLAIFAATSEANGRRVLITDFGQFDCFEQKQPDFSSSYSVTSGSEIRRTCVRPFNDSTDLSFLFEDDDYPDQDDWFGRFYSTRACGDCALPLSASASASARFPIVSPHANIRNANGAVHDRVVDGGYFENYGAIALLELSEAIVRIARRHGDLTFAPMAIIIKNEPNEGTASCATNGHEASGASDWAVVNQTTLNSSLSIPINTFLAARTARGRLAARRLCARLANIWRAAAPKLSEDLMVRHMFNLRLLANFFVEFDVDFADRTGSGISMNWWLSKQVQAGLDEVVQSRSFRRGGPIESVLEVLEPYRAQVRINDELAAEKAERD